MTRENVTLKGYMVNKRKQSARDRLFGPVMYSFDAPSPSLPSLCRTQHVIYTLSWYFCTLHSKYKKKRWVDFFRTLFAVYRSLTHPSPPSPISTSFRHTHFMCALLCSFRFGFSVLYLECSTSWCHIIFDVAFSMPKPMSFSFVAVAIFAVFLYISSLPSHINLLNHGYNVILYFNFW